MEDDIKVGRRNSLADQARLQAAHDALVEAGAVCASEIIESPIIDNPVKSISRTDDELRVANYIVVFGGRDLTGIAGHKNADGSSGEYFTKNTKFESPYTKTGILHVDFEHGLDPDDVGADENQVLGYVDWKTARIDDGGLFVERVLSRRGQYVQWLETLIDAGLVGNSSEAIRGQVRKADNGEILEWPLKRDSLTVMPMEPRMLAENPIMAKAIEALKSLRYPTQAEAAETAPAVDSKPEINVEKPMENAKMTDTPEIDVKAIALEAAKTAVEEYAKSLPAGVQAGANVQVTKDAADQPFKNAGEFFMAVKQAAYSPMSEDIRLRPLKASGMSESQPADGGYLVSSAIAGGILQNMVETGSLLSRISLDNVGPNSNGMVYNAIDESTRASSLWGGVIPYWLSEGGSKTASAPKFRQLELKLKKVAALAYASDELLADATALQSWLSREVPNALRYWVEEAIYNGDGVGKPLGIVAAPCLVSATRTDASNIDSADILRMYARRLGNGPYVWLINRDVTPELFALGSTYQSFFIPPGQWQSAPSGSLLGLPIIENEFSPTLGTLGDIVLADLSKYQAIQKGGIESASSIHVKFTTDETAFRFVYRFDGAPMLNSALTPHKGSATRSHFIALAATT